MKLIRSFGVAGLSIACLLAGCSSGGHPAANAASAESQWLAVARGEVGVEGGLVRIAARTDGVVATVAAKPGDAVKKGQVLATLDARAAKIAVATAKAGVTQAEAQQDELKVSLQQASARAPRVAAAAKAGAATGEAAAQAQAALATLKAKASAASAALDVAKQQLASAKLAFDMTELRAPVAGTVVARAIAIGQTVAASAPEPLFELLPDAPHVVHAQLDISAAGAVRAGMQANVVADSGGGPEYTATVTWVGQVLQPATLTRDPLDRALANDVDCTLTLDLAKPGTAPLRIGQRVLVRFPRPAK